MSSSVSSKCLPLQRCRQHWAAPGTWQLMGNAAFIATNPGFSDAYDPELGRTSPYLVADWLMARGRTTSGIFEGMLMLNFEAFTLGSKGWYEIGQAGEGLFDRQHAHQLLHQALVAVHAGDHVTFWGGQGRATTKVEFIRNINPRWNFGFNYRPILVEKMIQRFPWANQPAYSEATVESQNAVHPIAFAPHFDPEVNRRWLGLVAGSQRSRSQRKQGQSV